LCCHDPTDPLLSRFVFTTCSLGRHQGSVLGRPITVAREHQPVPPPSVPWHEIRRRRLCSTRDARIGLPPDALPRSRGQLRFEPVVTRPRLQMRSFERGTALPDGRLRRLRVARRQGWRGGQGHYGLYRQNAGTEPNSPILSVLNQLAMRGKVKWDAVHHQRNDSRRTLADLG